MARNTSGHDKDDSPAPGSPSDSCSPHALSPAPACEDIAMCAKKPAGRLTHSPTRTVLPHINYIRLTDGGVGEKDRFFLNLTFIYCN